MEPLQYLFTQFRHLDGDREDEAERAPHVEDFLRTNAVNYLSFHKHPYP